MMELSKQVCTPAQGKRLVELGIETESYFWHAANGITTKVTDIPAFSVAELGYMLGEPCLWLIECDTAQDSWLIWIDGSFKEATNTEAEARAWVLIHGLEHNLFSAHAINLNTGAAF